MPSLIEKLKNTVSNPGLDPEVQTALDQLNADSKLVDELELKQTKFLQQLAKVEEERDLASLPDDAGGNEALYKKLDAEAQRIAGEMKRNLAAIRAAGKRKEESHANLNKANSAGDVKIAKKFGRMRVDAMEEVAKGVAIAVAGWRKHFEINERLKVWRGTDLLEHPGGMMLRKDEIAKMVIMELERISSPAPLDERACPAFPGCRELIHGNPHKYPTLVDAAKEANAYMVTRIENNFAAAAPVPLTAEQAGAVQAFDGNDGNDGIHENARPPQPSFAEGQTVTAAQVAAQLGRRRMS